jgi:HKD family nuclease
MAKGADATRVKLLLNETPDHSVVLKSSLSSARRFLCMVAFARQSGLNVILKELKTALGAGLQARFVIGLDFCQTDPSLLEDLLRLSKRHPGLELFMGSFEAEATFHPKVFAFEGTQGVTVIVGSANLTGGGLENNHEASLQVRDQSDELFRSIARYIDSLITDEEVVPVKADLITEYSKRHAIYRAQSMLAQRRANRALGGKGKSLETLEGILIEMKQDESERGFDTQSEVRRKTRSDAQALLARISRTSSLSESDFLKLYEPLVSGTWHSGGLQRGKNLIAQHALAFQTALRSLDKLGPQSVERVFNSLRDQFLVVKGAGVNVMTEILHSFDNQKFAVMNQNSVSGMTLAQVTEFPSKPNKGNTDGAIYAAFCDQACQIRDRLGLADLTELDALFNYAYFDEE